MTGAAWVLLGAALVGWSLLVVVLLGASSTIADLRRENMRLCRDRLRLVHPAGRNESTPIFDMLAARRDGFARTQVEIAALPEYSGGDSA